MEDRKARAKVLGVDAGCFELMPHLLAELAEGAWRQATVVAGEKRPNCEEEPCNSSASWLYTCQFTLPARSLWSFHRRPQRLRIAKRPYPPA